MTVSGRDSLLKPLLRENPVTLHVLGICAALAITNSLTSSLIMSVAMTTVLVISNATISLIRRHLPASVRIIVQITIIASAVTVIDQVLSAFMPATARTLSVYISLIVTNCIVLGRAEACAMKNRLGASVLDAIGNGLGYSIILVIVATIRELFGNGSLMGYRLLELARDGGWFQPNEMLLLPPSAFFIIGFLVWVIRGLKPEQREQSEFEPVPLPQDQES
jgi:Na+-transporting NADH:ubiquinone oxidoreductase subunit D